jgi:hypothetical protein
MNSLLIPAYLISAARHMSHCLNIYCCKLVELTEEIVLHE